MSNTPPTAEDIQAALDEIAAADCAVWKARREKVPRPERAALERRFNAAAKAANALENAAIQHFAKCREWNYAPKKSGHHRWVFLDANKRVAGIVRHSNYSVAREEIFAKAKENGFDIEQLPFSWWAPRGEMFLLTPKKEPQTSANGAEELI